MPHTRIEELGDAECRALLAGRLRALPLYPWAPGDEARSLRVAPASLTGRRIRIPDELPFTWSG